MVLKQKQSKTTVTPKRPEAKGPEKALLPVTIMPELPEAFKTHDRKMSPIGLALAIEVGKRNPEIIQAVHEFREQYGRLGEKYFGMCKAVRTAKLVRKESTALLLGLGLSKSRVSEILTVAEVSDEVWNRYDQKQIGFKAALKSVSIADGKNDDDLGAGQAETKVPPSEPVKPKVVIREFSEINKPHVLAMLKVLVRPLHEGVQTDYALGAVIDGVKYYVALTASPK